MRTLGVGALLLVALGAGWTARVWLAPASATDEDGGNFVRVARGRLEQSVKARGIVKPAPNALIRVGFPMPKDVSRRIARLPWVEGDEVRRGELLAQLDCADLKATRDQLTAEVHVAERKLAALRKSGPLEVRTAEATRDQAKSQSGLAEKNHNRLVRLVPGGAASAQDLETAVSDLAVAKARVAQTAAAAEQIEARVETDIATLEAQLKLAQATLQTIEVQIGWSTLYAPHYAQVFAVHQQQGELTGNTPGAPVLTLLDPKGLQVHLYVDENDLGRVRAGQLVRLRVEAHPDKVIEGKIVRLLPRALLQENVVYYLAVVEPLESQKTLLRTEMTTQASIQAGVKENVLWLPPSALRSRPEGWYVLKRGPGGRVEVPVKIGWKGEGRVELVEGVAEGDEVIVGP